MVESRIIPYRIKQARISRGYSMGELADLINITRSAVSQYELGTIKPSDYIIGQLSNVLNYPISFFRKPVPENTTASSAVYFRSRRTTTKKAKSAACQKLSVFREIHNYLQKYIDFPKVNVPHCDAIDSTNELSLEEIQTIADDVRKQWNLGSGPIDNLIAVLQRNGIMISVMNLNNKKIDAFSVWYDSVPYIYLSTDKYSDVRLRFTLAHELGHLIMHSNLFTDEEIETKVIHDRIEHEADTFAACLLLPQQTFSKDIYSSSLDLFIQLKMKWKVSIGAMIYRCEALDILTANQIKYLKDQMSYNGYWREEPLDKQIPLETPFAHRQAFELILDNNLATPSEIVEEIGCYAKEIEEYSFLESGTLAQKNDSNIIQLKLRRTIS